MSQSESRPEESRTDGARSRDGAGAADAEDEVARLRTLLFSKERELRESHHRIANSLQLVSGFLLLQQKKLNDEVAKAALSAAAARLAAVSSLHRGVYAHTGESRVNLQGFLTDVCADIERANGLTCKVAADPVLVSGDVAQHLAIIINELALNAAKHAYGGASQGELAVECHHLDGRIRLVVADRGRGLPADFAIDGSHGLGMRILASAVDQLQGAIDFETRDGARFIIVAPVS